MYCSTIKLCCRSKIHVTTISKCYGHYETSCKPNYFLTRTSNPKWPKISLKLLSRETSIDRSDLVARVFQKKHMALLDLVLQNQILDKVVGHIYTVEF
jgi:hypothetical protein